MLDPFDNDAKERVDFVRALLASRNRPDEFKERLRVSLPPRLSPQFVWCFLTLCSRTLVLSDPDCENQVSELLSDYAARIMTDLGGLFDDINITHQFFEFHMWPHWFQQVYVRTCPGKLIAVDVNLANETVGSRAETGGKDWSLYFKQCLRFRCTWPPFLSLPLSFIVLCRKFIRILTTP